MEVKEKRCSCCKKFLQIEKFLNKEGKELKTCQYCCEQRRLWSQNNKERHKDWLLNNKEKVRNTTKLYRIKNENTIKEKSKIYRENNKDKIKERRIKGKEKHKEYVKEWNKNNPEKYKQIYEKCREKAPKFVNFIDRLTIDEDPKEGEYGELLVKCFRCGKYFSPKKAHIARRIASLSGSKNGESHLYCSQECKKACPIFRRREAIGGKKKRINLTRDSYWVEKVLERDNFTCVKCGSTKDIQAHHIIPISVDFMLSADIDNGETLCKKCHTQIHKRHGCTLTELANINKC